VQVTQFGRMGNRGRAFTSVQPADMSSTRGVGYESNCDRNCDMSELRLVRADRNASCRSSASEEGDFGRVTALR